MKSDENKLRAIQEDGKWYVIGFNGDDIRVDADSEEHADEIILNYYIYEQL